jgi:hypothetical protein
MSNILCGNIQNFSVISFVTGTVTTVVLNTTAARTFTVPGLLVGDFVAISKPTQQAGLGIVGARVSAADTLEITYSNNTGAYIQPTNETCALFWARTDATRNNAS